MTGRGRANDVDGNVGHRMRLRRTSLGMSQEELGRALGLTFQQIQKYENGQNRISAGHLFSVARALRVPVSYFFENVDQPDPLSALPPAVRQFVMSREGISLWRQFTQVKNPKVRQRVLDLVIEMAESEQN